MLMLTELTFLIPIGGQWSGLKEHLDFCILCVCTRVCVCAHVHSHCQDMLRLCLLPGPGYRDMQQLHSHCWDGQCWKPNSHFPSALYFPGEAETQRAGMCRHFRPEEVSLTPAPQLMALSQERWRHSMGDIKHSLKACFSFQGTYHTWASQELLTEDAVLCCSPTPPSASNSSCRNGMLRPRERLPFLHKGKNVKHNNASWNLRNCLALCLTLQNIYSHMYSYISTSVSITTLKCLQWERQILIHGPPTDLLIAVSSPRC